MIKILVLNGSPRSDGNTAAMINAFREAYEGDFLDYLGLEGCGIFTNHDDVMNKIRAMAASL